MASSDLKTLRLASVPVTEAQLSKFLRYEAVMLEELARARGDWAGRLAFAHGRALNECGLDVMTLHRLKAVVREFCGKRSVAARLEAKLAQAADAEVRDRIVKELARVGDLQELEARHGEQALRALTAREAELLRLHEALVRVEGAAGHLHPPERG